ncbi:hypothetical protein QYM36_008204 [Artemia franciscana]|uniref:RBD domain-containing protein n=2 Tax=Artemia franciscana TaxID=6661 RepID=A0AA88IUK4_ARTSF|nr:hypothetical protein QYM36_008204 [Artemia franciscana]
MPALPYVRAVSGTNGQITEDTPADFLEGDMEIQVVLPNGKSVKSYFNRRTQMMDLLVQIGTRHQLATGDHFLQITDDVTGNPIPFLPSSVLGALDVRTVFVVPKSRINATKLGKKLNLPFEQTFRLKVYLPKNQLFVTRVSASTLLSTVLSIVCKEKQLNPKAYELRHPVNRLEPLNLSATLEDYNLCEVALVTARSQDISSDNWEEMPRKTSMNGSSVAIQPPPPQKQKRGLFSFVFGKKTSKTSVVNSSSLSGGSIGDRSVSPVRSTSPDVSNSISPTTPPLATSSVVSAPSYSEKISSAKSLETMSMISDTSSTKGSGGVARFKKRQAPAPPPVNRMSSPLSKEHLSKLPETSKLQSAFSKSTSNLAYENRPGNRLSLSNLATANSTSTSSILSALRKSKKAPPPPSNAVHSSEATDERMVEEDKPVPTTKTEEATTIRTPEVEIKVEEPPVIVDKPSPVDTIDKKGKIRNKKLSSFNNGTWNSFLEELSDIIEQQAKK